MPFRTSIGRSALLALATVWLPAGLQAAPAVRNVTPRGLQVGGTTTLVFEGANLLPDPRVALHVPVASQQVRGAPTASRVEIEVTLPAGLNPGFYNLFLSTGEGLSSPATVALDAMPQQPFAATAETLPVALHGTLSGSAVSRTSFAGKAGQQVVCEVETNRLGAKLRPVLHLYGPDGRHLAWSLPERRLQGDTRLQATLPVDGVYVLSLNDLQYAAPSPNFFRLKIGAWQYADLAFPLAAQRGRTTAVRLLGSSPTATVNLSMPPDAWQLFVPWPNALAASGPRPEVQASDLAEFVEGGQPAVAMSAPAAINGWLSAPGEEDTYQIQVEPGSKLRFELFADRRGSPLDSVLKLSGEKGNVLAQNDDAGPHTDSALDFTVPADVRLLSVGVRDALGRGGDPFIYRLLVTPIGKPAAQDFELLIDQEFANVPTGGKQVLKVRAERNGYAGPVQLTLQGLPSGVTADAPPIAAGATAGLITLNGATATAAAFITIRGQSVDTPQTLVRTAHAEPVSSTAPAGGAALTTDALALAVAPLPAAGFAGDWQLAAADKLVLGSKAAATVRSVRPAGFDGAVRVSLLTSQSPARTNGSVDNNRTLRLEPSPSIEIPPDGKAVAAWDAKLAAEKQVAEMARARDAAAVALKAAQQQAGANLEAATQAVAAAEQRLREAETKKTAAEQAAQEAAVAANNDLEFKLFVPAELPTAEQQLSLRLELLSRDKQVVLASLCTPVRAVRVVNPLALHYAGPAKQQLKLDAKTGAAVKLAGKIERLEGLAGEVAVTVSGLTAGVAAPRSVVKPDQADFELEIKFPPNFAPGELRDVKLFATGKLDAQAPVENRSQETPLTFELLPPD